MKVRSHTPGLLSWRVGWGDHRGQGYDYLTKEVATSKHDYYTGAGEAPGRWAGRSAGLLGLSGEVDANDMAMLYGRFVVPSTAGGRWLPST